MARYIDADKLKRDLIDNRSFYPAIVKNAIENAPTEDVVSRSEVNKIFEKIENCMRDFEDDDDGYILKKCEFEFFMRELKNEYIGETDHDKTN